MMSLAITMSLIVVPESSGYIVVSTFFVPARNHVRFWTFVGGLN